MKTILSKGIFLLFVACLYIALVFLTTTARAGLIHCDVYQNTAPYEWTVAGSFDCDAINFPPTWQPYGLSVWIAEFTSPITVAGSGGQGFEYLQSGYYVNAGIGAYPFQGIGASWSTPGVTPGVMTRFDGWNLSPGLHTFQFSVINSYGQSAGAIVNWDPGVRYGVPEPATLAQLVMGALALGSLALIRIKRR